MFYREQLVISKIVEEAKEIIEQSDEFCFPCETNYPFGAAIADIMIAYLYRITDQLSSSEKRDYLEVLTRKFPEFVVNPHQGE
jgi:hypothetical protein